MKSKQNQTPEELLGELKNVLANTADLVLAAIKAKKLLGIYELHESIKTTGKCRRDNIWQRKYARQKEPAHHAE